MNSSARLTVLVTRPEQQAAGLHQALLEADFDVRLFPVIEIQAVTPGQPLSDTLRSLDQFDFAIFISTNAVDYFWQLLNNAQRQWPAGLKTLAVGHASAERLRAHGVLGVLVPADQRSEGLLSLAELQQLENQRVLIVRGQGGRDYLAQQLTARGAQVSYCEVYQRCLPAAPDYQVFEHWDPRHCVIVCTSNAGIENLLQLTRARLDLLSTPLLVVSARQQAYAHEKGFAATVRAPDASSEAIVNTLNHYQLQRS